jgi:hypothetical protein
MDTMVAPVVRLSIGIARLFQDVFVGERKWSRRMPGTPEYEAWEAKRAKYAAAIKSSGQRARVPFPKRNGPRATEAPEPSRLVPGVLRRH